MGNTRKLAVLAALLVVAVVPSTGAARTPKAPQMVQLQTALLAQINVFRATHGLTRLKINGALPGESASPAPPGGRPPEKNRAPPPAPGAPFRAEGETRVFPPQPPPRG